MSDPLSWRFQHLKGGTGEINYSVIQSIQVNPSFAAGWSNQPTIEHLDVLRLI